MIYIRATVHLLKLLLLYRNRHTKHLSPHEQPYFVSFEFPPTFHTINVNDNMYSFDHFKMYNFDYYAFLFSPNLSTTLGWGRDYRV